jgi:hypothetical protein
MDDAKVTERIEELAREEHALFEKSPAARRPMKTASA